MRMNYAEKYLTKKGFKCTRYNPGDLLHADGDEVILHLVTERNNDHDLNKDDILLAHHDLITVWNPSTPCYRMTECFWYDAKRFRTVN